MQRQITFKRNVSTTRRSYLSKPRTSAPRITKRNINTGDYTNSLTFYLNGKKKVLQGSNVEPDHFLIQYLRKEGLTGTKLTCGEGGCGACTVTLSHFDKGTRKVVHRAVNACLVPLCYVDGMEVTTVEGLGSVKSGKLHPVQERMAELAGSQCGFCTPGFVMSMYTGLRNNPKPTALELQKCIDGNLCRCTGYRPILDVVKSFSSDKKDEFKVPSGKTFAEYDPTKEPELPNDISQFRQAAAVHIKGTRAEWFSPLTLNDVLDLKKEYPHAKIVSGNTELGIEYRYKNAKFPVLISPTQVPELNVLDINNKGMLIGSAVTLSELNHKLEEIEQSLNDNEQHKRRLIRAITDQLHWFAGTQIRNVASVGGNIVNASPISDLNPVWIALDAEFKVKSQGAEERMIPAKDFFLGYKKLQMEPTEVLVSIHVPWNEANEYVESYKQSKRREDDIAIVTSTMNVKLDSSGKVVHSRLAFGGMGPITLSAVKTQEFLKGKAWNEDTFSEAVEVLRQELGLKGDPPGGMAEFRTALTLSFFYKFYLSVLKEREPDKVPPQLLSATAKLYKPSVPSSKHVYDVPKRGTSVGDPEPMLSAKKQVTGEAMYTDDIPSRFKEAYAVLVTSTRPHAKILKVDPSEALKMKGVQGYFGHKDVPGSNLWGDIVHDEELFASDTVVHYGQPIGVIVAEDEFTAKVAALSVQVEYEDKEAIFTIQDAIKKNSFFPLVHGLKDGNVEQGFKESDKIIEGDINITGQEQFYFEPQSSIAVPQEEDMIVYSSTQNANKTQKITASVLGVPINKVVCKVARIGGGFGGKETRNINFAGIAAVAAHHLNRPVRLILERDLDMTISGGRHPFYAKYKVGFTNDGLIKAADLQLYSNGGISHDLSNPVMDRALLFCDGCYKIPNIKNVGTVCKTNVASHTAFRGFGGPQGQLITEAWVEHMADELGVRPEVIREKNMYKEGDLTYYGQQVTKNIRRSWDECKQQSEFDKRVEAIEKFNKENRYRKRGISMMPSKYGIAFTAFFLNQGAAMIHVYIDGSVLVTHGGVEMGQGLNTKVAQVVASELGIPVSKVHIQEMATDKIPNASPTAASMGSDIYGGAALNAARELNARLEPYRKAMPGASFKEIATKAYFDRVNLMATGFFKSEHPGFDFEKGGLPWRYFTLGTAFTEVEIDCLTGDHKVLRSDLVVDVGTPINPAIDIGQIEGAFMQGAGWVSIEELVWGDNQHPWVRPGRLFTAGPGAYKIPSADDIPSDWRITLLKDTPVPKYEVVAVQSSKAVGEPPFLLGTSVYTAIRDAIKYARRQEGLTKHFHLDSPLSSERIRMACVDRFTRAIFQDNNAAESFRAKISN